MDEDPRAPTPEPELSSTLAALRRRGAQRDRALATLFDRHKARLLRMLDIRMDPRLRARVDASDVLQETWIEAIERVDAYAAKPTVPFLVWLRFLAAQKLVTLQRRHLGAKRRDVRRQVSLFRRTEFPEASSAVLVRDLAQQASTPSQGAMRAETQRRLLEAVEGMRPADREVLALRHFEELTTAEAAAELGMTEEATRKRYLRAVHRLRTVLDRDADAPNP